MGFSQILNEAAANVFFWNYRARQRSSVVLTMDMAGYCGQIFACVAVRVSY